MKNQQTIAEPKVLNASLPVSTNAEIVIADMLQLQQSLLLLENESLSKLPASRRLKIQPLIRERDYDCYNQVPGINLSGKWLMDSGFHYHRHARIIPMEGLLVICTEKIP
jgi:hypothetical protein